MGAKNRRKNLQKHPGPPFQIRPGPGCFSIASKFDKIIFHLMKSSFSKKATKVWVNILVDLMFAETNMEEMSHNIEK